MRLSVDGVECEYENGEKPTGLDMMQVYQRALDKVEGEVKWG